MVKTANQKETVQTLKDKMVSLYKYLLKQKDLANAEKIKQLARKLESREFMIAFCGHFSAGKSTMINQVVGENLLPSSPIPTSANLVKVKTGEEYAKVIFKHEKPRLYLAPYDYNLVKNYCKDGDHISEIEISHRDSSLPENTVILDTPGIDSADDAHRIATESAIHLADMVFYVMDYNHVQAELNFLFTRELNDVGKEVYLVINQIDKHKEEELSFNDFQESVVESFASWGVQPARIFYTSLREENNLHNEFTALQKFISEKLMFHDQLLLPSISQSIQKIAQDHLNQYRQLTEEQLRPVHDILEELTDEQKKELSESFQEISSKLESIKGNSIETAKEFDQQIAQLLKNAYLMPFQTRALAEAYLQACQPEFKVGLFFSKQKTLEEKNTRLDQFYEDVLEKTKSQLEWHVRDFLLRTIKELDLNHMELQSLAQTYTIEVPMDLLVNTVKPGARLTGEYVLNYTEDVVAEIKKMARKGLHEFKAKFLVAFEENNSKLKEQFEKEYSQTERYMSALAKLNDFEQSVKKKTIHVNNIIQNPETFNQEDDHLFFIEEEEYEVVKSQVEKKSEQPLTSTTPSSAKKEEKSITRDSETTTANDHLSQAVKRLHHSSSLIKSLPGFQKLSSELEDKANRLENKGFTVALFGAFSAGKSSFANALMGEKVLPVSPNPTTAAINKIKPVSNQYPHGTVLVKFKEKEAMLEDVNRSLKVFELHAENFEQAYKIIDQIFIKKGQEDLLEKTHFAFLQAFSRGFQTLGNSLGTILETDLTEFTDFVAKEEKSCYLEWIELYYDCELTRKGITLVDTPGADSINARHTGVAFDYIKNSDAILFVTYYNHAFSKADREFLIQLGRVKESFQMDKMFFIINAIDLAENEEEKETVAEYVQDQLIKYGIRNPHLYSLSSLLALKEKLNSTLRLDSGMSPFEEAFYHFISNDLTEMAVTSAENELSRVQGLIEKLVLSSREDRNSSENRRLVIEKQKELIKELFVNQTIENLQNRLTQEAEELIFYIKQRVFLRFGDFFKEAFNPSTLRDDGRNLKKALSVALDEFLESLGFDFAQEMRATTVRLERFIGKLFFDYHFSLSQKLIEVNPDLSFSMFDLNLVEKIEFQTAFKNVNNELFTKAMSFFKNPKSFFEKNEKKLMSEELHNVLNDPADEYLKVEAERMIHHYLQEMEKEFNRLISQMSEQVDDYYFSLLSTLDGGVSVDVLIEIQQKMSKLQ